MTQHLPAGPSADLELARRCAAGDGASQRQLFEAHRQRVYVILYRILGAHREIEDLIQESFLAIFGSLGRYRGDASLGTWIDRITTRIAFRYLSRRPAVGARLELVRLSADEGPRVEEELHEREAARRLYAILEGLAPNYRIAFALHVLDERPLFEVAVIIETSLVTAKVRVWRARQMVKQRAKADPLLRDYSFDLERGAR